ncbi:MAG: homoserine O-acetyltransferase, partial [Cycloclasticus sp.]
MSTTKTDSVGIVQPQTRHFEEPLLLECGKVIEQYDIVYETYGTLNKKADNAVLVCHALSADHHAAGYH